VPTALSMSLIRLCLGALPNGISTFPVGLPGVKLALAGLPPAQVFDPLMSTSDYEGAAAFYPGMPAGIVITDHVDQLVAHDECVLTFCGFGAAMYRDQRARVMGTHRRSN